MGRRGGEKGVSEVLLGLQKARLSIIWVILQKYLIFLSRVTSVVFYWDTSQYYKILHIPLHMSEEEKLSSFMTCFLFPEWKKKLRIYPKFKFYFARSSSECKQFSSVLAHVATIFYKRGSRSLRVNKFILFSNICVFFLFCWERGLYLLKMRSPPHIALPWLHEIRIHHFYSHAIFNQQKKRKKINRKIVLPIIPVLYIYSCSIFIYCEIIFMAEYYFEFLYLTIFFSPFSSLFWSLFHHFFFFTIILLVIYEQRLRMQHFSFLFFALFQNKFCGNPPSNCSLIWWRFES